MKGYGPGALIGVKPAEGSPPRGRAAADQGTMRTAPRAALVVKAA